MNYKLLIISFFVCITQITFSQEIEKFYYPDSTISAQGIMRNGKPDGYWISFYPSGIIKSKGKRTNFELDSIWNFYDEKGRIEKEISYYQDKKNGFYKEYSISNDSLFLSSKLLYVNNLRQGNAEYYYSNGSKKKVIPYSNDKLQGQGFEYENDTIISAILGFENNQLISRQVINKTNAKGEKVGTWIEFYPNGNIKTEGQYKNGKLDGIYKLFDSHQRLLRVGNYENDSLLFSSAALIDFEEPFEIKEFYKDSTLKFKGSFRDNKPIGVQRFYNEQGEIIKSEHYNSYGLLLAKGILLENGKKHGYWFYYDSLGKIESEGNYSNNERSGIWKFYYNDATLKQEGSYAKNKPSGTWTWYYENGKILRIEEFAAGKRNGKFVEYNEQGEIIITGVYTDDKQQGKWITKNGDITSYETYEYGDKIKTWYSLYSNGNKQFKGKYFTNKPHGKHNYFYNNGTLEHQEIYVYGKPSKAWTYYSKQGELLYTVYYKKGKEFKIVMNNGKG